MNKGFGYYFKEGFQVAGATFRGKIKNRIAYLVFLIASLLSAILVLPFPAFQLASYNLDAMASSSDDFIFSKAFQKSGEPRTYWTLFLYNLVYAIVFLAALALTAGAGFGMFILGLALPRGNTSAARLIGLSLGGVFAFPFALASLAVLFLGIVYFLPRLFILHANPKIDLSDLAYDSFKSYRKNGKATAFLLILVNLLFLALYVAIAYLCVFYCFMAATAAGMIAGIVLIAIFAGVLLYFLPLFLFASSISLYLLNRDLCDYGDYDVFAHDSRKGQEYLEVLDVDSGAKTTLTLQSEEIFDSEKAFSSLLDQPLKEGVSPAPEAESKNPQ